MSKKAPSILYLSEEEDETLSALGEEAQDEEQEEEQEDSPFKNGDETQDSQKCYSVAKSEIKEKSEQIPYKKNPPATSRRDLVGKFEKELQCQYCERPYRQRHHLLAHEAKTCPVVLQMARDKLMTQLKPEKTKTKQIVVEESDDEIEEVKQVVQRSVPVKKRKPFNPPPPPADYPRQKEKIKRKQVIVYEEVPESSEEDEPEPIVIKPRFKFGGR